MPWVKLDDGFTEHDKVTGLSDRSFRLHVTALCYCARNLTDGVVTTRALRIITAIADISRPNRNVDELVSAGVWDIHREGHEIHDYTEYNPTAEEVRETKESKQSTKRRQRQLLRDGELRFDIRSRDGSFCRYCGVEVNWHDRKGTTGATYDHVDPDGGNTIENVVVACRSCNSRKGQRTPSEAGMPLGIKTGSSTGSKPDLGTGSSPHARVSPPVPVPPFSKDDALTRDDGRLGGTISTSFGVMRLVSDIGGGGETRTKVDNALRSYTISDHDLDETIRCCNGPGVEDKLAVALSELKKRRRKAA